MFLIVQFQVVSPRLSVFLFLYIYIFFTLVPNDHDHDPVPGWSGISLGTGLESGLKQWWISDVRPVKTGRTDLALIIVLK